LNAARVAEPEDLEGLTATLTAAFGNDPLWTWAFPDPEKLRIWWRFLIGSALRYPCTWTLDDFAAVAVWIPPEGVELTEDEQDQIEPLLRELAGPRAGEISELIERFDATHPDGPPHYYLSLLGVHPERRGEGLGIGLLEQNLARTDAEGMPAYLESSNSANDARYESLGFRKVGSFTTPGDEVTVATMWRDPARS
jgi:GNAT superfamily N-acetyltransferase